MTTYNDTPVNNPLVINQLTQNQFDNATSIAEDELYLVDPQFTGGKILVSTADGDIAEGTVDPSTIVTDVEVDGTSVVTSGVASITLPVTDVQQDGASIVSAGVATVPNAVVFRDWD